MKYINRQIQHGTLRISLGRKTIGDNLITVPGSNNWADVCTPGKFYRVEFDLTDDPSTDYNIGVAVALGGFDDRSPSSAWIEPSSEHYVYDAQCIRGTGLHLYTYGLGGFSNVAMRELVWDDPINAPMDASDLKGNIQRNIDLSGLSIIYTSHVTFRGESYQYIYNAWQEQGFGAIVPVRVEYYKAGKGGVGAEWRDLFEGTIVISDCEFDFANCSVEVDIRDRNATILLKSGEDTAIPFGFYSDDAGIKESHPGHVDNSFNTSIALHDDSGTYSYTVTNHYAFKVKETFQRLIEECTDGAVTLVSDFFDDDDFANLAIAKGQAFIDGALISDQCINDLSFKQFFDELNKIFNLSYAFEYPDGIPTVRIEDKSAFIHRTPVLTLQKVKNAKMTFDLENLYRNIKSGYKDRDLLEGGNVSNYTSIDHASVRTLDNVSEFVQDSDIIFGQLSDGASGSDYGYADSIFIIQMDGTLSKKFPVGGRQLYDQDINPDDNFGRWAETLSGRQWIESGTGKRYFASNSFARLYQFDVPLKYEEFKALQAPGASVIFSGDGVPAPMEALIIEVNYDFRTLMSQFRVIA